MLEKAGGEEILGLVKPLDELAGYAELWKRLQKLDGESINAFLKDFQGNPALLNTFNANPKLVDSWKSFKNAGLDDLARNPIQLQKFDDLVKSNKLGLDAKGLEDLLSAPKAKGLKRDNPDGVLDAVKRASDAGVDGVSISHKKFPTPSEGSDPFVLKKAKLYQKEASGDAALSFDKGGRSFDNVTSDGKLVDRKYGHGSSIFKEVDDGLGGKEIIVHNKSREASILTQAEAQVNAASGSRIKWEVSTDLGAKGIKQTFQQSNNQLIKPIEVVYVPQKQ